MFRVKNSPAQENRVENRSSGGDFFCSESGVLTLSDGTMFRGVMPAWQKSGLITETRKILAASDSPSPSIKRFSAVKVATATLPSDKTLSELAKASSGDDEVLRDSVWHGEVVFNTGMTGYVESLTDPSYSGQILVFTYPLIGNYGVNELDGESKKVQVRGVIVSEAVTNWCHAGSDIGLLAWLEKAGVPVLSGVDTRALTKHLRTRGVMAGAIGAGAVDVKALKLEDCFAEIPEEEIYNPNEKKTVILVDCGAKENIARSLARFPVRIRRVPHTYDFTGDEYDAVFLSNGPGNPETYTEAIQNIKKVLTGDKPVFGICLGSQLMALAVGAKTYKLKFGHRGHNQPCQNVDDEHCYITSQNHGYAVDAKTLPKGWRVWFKNLNDDSVEGIQHESKPFSSVQFHPEACPGPTDTQWLFERFIQQL